MGKEYVRYSGLAFQMMAIIAAGTYGGLRIDKHLDWKFPAFTLALSLSSVGLAMWLAVRDFLKK